MKNLFNRVSALLFVLVMVIMPNAAYASNGIGVGTDENGTVNSSSTLDIRISGTELYGQAWDVLDILNEERKAEGLSTLKMDEDLMEAAMIRAAELAVFYDHVRPNGESNKTVTDAVPYYGTAENIAAGSSYKTAAVVMNAWMNSAGHRANILYPTMQRIGIGVFYNCGIYYWVQIINTSATTNEAVRNMNSVEVTRTISVAPSVVSYSGNTYQTINLKAYGGYVYANKNQEVEVQILNANARFGSAYAFIDTTSDFSYTTTDPSVAIYKDGKIVTGSDGTAYVTLYLTGYPDSYATFTVTVFP